ncbi:MAG: ABC transporter ATP-binding protein [Bacteroidetes bacterium]|nr:ABC transporter ATP-binding protein [Bacteroidota bacterium]MDA0950317.1 ABC transporter ATP-binding protein [Bacteroidota bacterium]
MKALRHLNKYFLKYWKKLLIGLLITASARISSLVMPSYINKSIQTIERFFKEEITREAAQKLLAFDIGIIISTTAMAALFTFLMRQYIINVSRYIEFDLKNEVFGHYLKLSLNFFKKNRVGDLMNRLSEDVSQVRMYAGPAIMYGLQTLTLFLILIPLMFIKAPTLALYTVLPFPLLSLLIYSISKRIHQRSTEVQAFLSTLSTFTQEHFSGIAVVKAYGLEPQIDKDIRKLSVEGKETAMHLAKINAWFFPLMLLLIGASNIIVMYVGGRMYIEGRIDSVGLIAEFILYVNMLTWPVTVVGWLTSIIQRAEASQERINAFLTTEPDLVSGVHSLEQIRGKLSFEKVSLTYEDTEIEALKEVSFSVNPGETLAILGKTGSGKSSIVDLVSRLLDPSSGKVLLDDRDLKEFDLQKLRTEIGAVPQDSFLFSETIRANIQFGLNEASEEQIIRAAKMADVHDNILTFPKGYDTLLGERGISLSGGQKQRVAIARALIKNAKLYIFDDCLSAVDTETEEVILEHIKNLTKHKTTLIVSHRISTIKHANRILVLDQGRVVQEGTHSKLIEEEGFYKHLYQEQLVS